MGGILIVVGHSFSSVVGSFCVLSLDVRPWCCILIYVLHNVIYIL